jgi:hypothetical protein
MFFCSKKIRFFFVSLFVSLSSLFSASIGGGILPYAYYKGHAYIFVVCDNRTSSKVWGDLGVSSIKDYEDFYYKISSCSHFGTFGMFSGVTDKLFASVKKTRKLAFNEGVAFFSSKLQDQDRKHFATKHDTNQGDLLYHLFFVKVPFVEAHFFMENMLYLRINFASLFANYGRGMNGFAWISVEDLLELVNKLNKFEVLLRSEMRFTMRTENKNSVFFAKPSDLSYASGDLVLNEYLSEELRTDLGISMLKTILQETPKWALKSTH